MARKWNWCYKWLYFSIFRNLFDMLQNDKKFKKVWKKFVADLPALLWIFIWPFNICTNYICLLKVVFVLFWNYLYCVRTQYIMFTFSKSTNRFLQISHDSILHKREWICRYDIWNSSKRRLSDIKYPTRSISWIFRCSEVIKIWEIFHFHRRRRI